MRRRKPFAQAARFTELHFCVRDELDSYRSVLTAIRMRDVAAARAAMGTHLTVNPMQAIFDTLTGRIQKVK